MSGLQPTLGAATPELTCESPTSGTYTIQDDAVANLSDGEFVLDIQKTGKQPAFICTSSLQIHCQQAKLLVINSGAINRVTVLDGKATVKNILDHSVVRLSPGVVYESTALPAAIPKQATPYDEIRNTSTILPLFVTKKSQSCLYPLAFHSKVSSKIKASLIEGALSASQPQPTNWARCVTIVTAPTKMNYLTGVDTLRLISLPRSIALNFPPTGTIQPSALQVQIELIAGRESERQD